MEASDLIQKSPFRALEAALGGELGKGNLGVVIARHGAGKTPFVVNVALDGLLRGHRVLHVSLDNKVDHVRDYYEQIFTQLVKSAGSKDEPGVFLEMERHRRIHTYLGNKFTIAKLANAVEFMGEHADFRADTIVIDDFTPGGIDDVKALRAVAAKAGAELWMTAVRHREEPGDDPDGIAPPVDSYKDETSAIIDVRGDEEGGHVRLLLPKLETELGFVLDPTTMLVSKQ